MDKMRPDKESQGFTWGTGLWIGRSLAESDIKFILAALEKWSYTAYYWLPEPNSELDWHGGVRFYVHVKDRSTWTAFRDEILPVLTFQIFTWIETEPVFDSNLLKTVTPFTHDNLNHFLRFTQRFESLNL